MIVTVDFEV